MILSMTGFARLTRQTDIGQFTIELKSVNHRYCEIQFFLPEIFSSFELPWRNLLKENLKRGRIDCGLHAQWYSGSQQSLPIDENLLSKILEATDHLSKKSKHIGTISPLDILKWPGIINPELLNLDQLQQNLTDALKEAVDILTNVRAQEGQQIKIFIEEHLNEIRIVVQEIRSRLPELLGLQQQRLLKKFEEAKIQIDPERLAQEMVLFAQRIDIAEELERLEIHLKSVHDLLNHSGSIGRRLDFIMQELNREANTLGSKSLLADITQQVVTIKVDIEEMREQIQNIE